MASKILLLEWYISAWSFVWRFAIHKQPDHKSEKQPKQRIEDIAQIPAVSLFQQWSPISADKIITKNLVL